MSARDAILGRIRAALAPAAGDRQAVEERLRRRRRGPLPTVTGDMVERFRNRAAALSSTVDGPVTPGQAPARVAHYLAQHRLPLEAVCWPGLAGYDWAAAGITVEPRPARGSDLVGITGAFCAIAETGTLMLLSGPETPATASLLPETHVALLPVDAIVAHMEDAWDRLRTEFGRMPRAVNFVSGPSRTADIEQTVTLGAHGPYRVLIVLVAGG